MTDAKEAFKKELIKQQLEAAVKRYGRQFVKHELNSAQRERNRRSRESRERALEVLRYELGNTRSPARRRKLEGRIGRVVEELRKLNG